MTIITSSQRFKFTFLSITHFDVVLKQSWCGDTILTWPLTCQNLHTSNSRHHNTEGISEEVRGQVRGQVMGWLMGCWVVSPVPLSCPVRAVLPEQKNPRITIVISLSGPGPVICLCLWIRWVAVVMTFKMSLFQGREASCVCACPCVSECLCRGRKISSASSLFLVTQC